MQARTVEFHEYSRLKRRVCANHSDYGSLFTADVMLSDTSDFEGGRMVTSVVEEGCAAMDSEHTFEQGDLLIFPSHKPHSVRQVTAGTRIVFVVEFWRGPACTCDCRCMGMCAEDQSESHRKPADTHTRTSEGRDEGVPWQ